MKLQVQSLHFDADGKLIDFIQKKLDKLETFYDKIIGAEVILRLEKDDGKENKIVEAKLSIPGNDLFAKEKAKSFEAATDEVYEALRRQLHKYKDKITSHS